MRGLDVREQRPVQARLSDTSPQGYDLSRLRQQSANNAGMPPVRGIQALRFSDEPSRQVAAAGAALAQWADVRRQIGIQQADELDRARVTDAQNQYMEAVLDAANNEQSGWKQRQGVAAMPDKTKQRSLDDEVFEKLNKRRTEIIDSLGNDRQKAAFAEYAAQEDFRQKQAIQAHVLQQSQQYKINSEEGGIAVAGKMIATAADEQEREQAFAKLEQHIAGIGHLQGLEGDALQAARQQYAGQYVSAAINERINAGDLNGAGMMLERYRDYMDGITISRAHDVLRVAQENQLVNEVVQDYIGSGEVDFVAAEPGDPYAVFNQGFNDAKYRKKAFGVESSNNPTARPIDKKTGERLSSAYGYAQALSGTWLTFGNSAVGRQLRGNMTDKEWLAKRADKDHANAFMDWYRDESIAHFRRTKVPVNDTTMYLAHFLGWHDAARVYNAPPGTPNSKKVSNWNDRVNKKGKRVKGAYSANKSVFDNNPTTDKLIAWAARKMDVKPTANPATGTPQKRKNMSYGEMREAVANDPRLANRHDLQEKVLSGMNRRQNEIAADEKAAKDEALLQASNELSANHGDLTKVSPEVWASVDDADKQRIEQYALGVRSHENNLIEANNTVYMLEMTSKEALAELNEATLRREWLDGKMSDNQYAQMVKLLRTYQESLEREQKGGKPSLFDFNDEYYSKTQLYDRVQQWAGIDKYGKMEPEQKRQLERIELYAKREGQRILDASMQAGVPFDMAAYEAALMRIMREELKTGGKTWWFGDETAPVYQVPVGDMPFVSIMDEAEDLQEARQYQPRKAAEPYDQFQYGPIW